ncbi:hypothetical protein [Paenibacillus alvei]|uniref:hypothetical protein n=1 Tax=Paenibacillus alvei TaxID=44250 RepID=UPI00227F458C|nr:hypothetical protein [Paenibacillus alvei]
MMTWSSSILYTSINNCGASQNQNVVSSKDKDKDEDNDKAGMYCNYRRAVTSRWPDAGTLVDGTRC